MPEIKNETTMMPMLALRGLSVFPGMLLTFDVERPASVAALDMAVKADQIIFLAAQKDLTADMPEEKDIYHVGSVCRIRQQLRQASNGVCRVMVEGLYRAEALEMRTEAKGYAALVRPLPDKAERVSSERMEALLRSCLSLFLFPGLYIIIPPCLIGYAVYGLQSVINCDCISVVYVTGTSTAFDRTIGTSTKYCRG